MFDKMNSTGATHREVIMAWQRLAITACTSTWSSGKNFITCRFLSSGLSAPSSPFDSMGAKLQPPRTFADVCYTERLKTVLKSWSQRDEFHTRCAILGLPRAYAQLESYWMLWVPNELADVRKHMVECVSGLHDEYQALQSTKAIRVEDLKAQLRLISSSEITSRELRASVRASCSLATGGKLGWSWIGSLASAHALSRKSSPGEFDRRFGKGLTHRSIVDHLTVRHSARLDENGVVHKGTVAEMILESGCDVYLSRLEHTYRFLFVNVPVFFNHPKAGEHKDREISITDPDSRIMLNDAEYICGNYGKTTGVDYLKVPNKDAVFYRKSATLMQRGCAIQSSDATRYGPMMSNYAIAIMLTGLGTRSMHLKWASVVYARLAYRIMLLPTDIYPELQKMEQHADTRDAARQMLAWMRKMPVHGSENGVPLVGYTTATHMGQGMSHHSSSLLHAGGLVVSQDAVDRCVITVNGKRISFVQNTMVTSDDSTLLPEARPARDTDFLTRAEKQLACRLYLFLQRHTRAIALRVVSVLANLPKELIAGNKGEFNSQDTGIGYSCPILGFRELISCIVSPSAPSLIGDYLNAHANAKTVAFAGQGMDTGNYLHTILIDAIEQRWSMTPTEISILKDSVIVPTQLIRGACGMELASSPVSWLSSDVRAMLYSLSVKKNVEKEDLDPHVRDTVFSPMMHVKLAMRKQHRKALSCIADHVAKLQDMGMTHQAVMLELSKRATVSSARTRNLGRVASRIRYKNVQPSDFLTFKFNRAPMMEATLSWIALLNQKVQESEPDIMDVQSSAKLSGFIRLVDPSNCHYPRPPTKRRFVPVKSKKPLYRDQGYGTTPFGAHALHRSGTSVVPKIGPAERQALQEHLAKLRHRSFTEHIEYGDSFVTSWHQRTSCKIVALDITGDAQAQEFEHIRWGDFSPKAISVLQSLCAEHPHLPVLALHRYGNGKGLWHCVRGGVAYTVAADLDIEIHEGQGIHWLDSAGNSIILALQGFADAYEWNGVGPSAEEVADYQHSRLDIQVPHIVRMVERNNMTQAKVTIPTYSTIVPGLVGDVLVYVEPEVHSTPYDNPSLAPYAFSLRGKVIAELATASYWHTSLQGTCFRAFLKGHWCNDTIWTGAALGWRLTATSMPQYYTSENRSSRVEALICLDGVDDPELLGLYNPDLFSRGVKVVTGSKTLSYGGKYRVSAAQIPLILAANSGLRHMNSAGGGTFLNLGHGLPTSRPAQTTPEDAVQQLINVMMGMSVTEGW